MRKNSLISAEIPFLNVSLQRARLIGELIEELNSRKNRSHVAIWLHGGWAVFCDLKLWMTLGKTPYGTSHTVKLELKGVGWNQISAGCPYGEKLFSFLIVMSVDRRNKRQVKKFNCEISGYQIRGYCVQNSQNGSPSPFGTDRGHRPGLWHEGVGVQQGCSSRVAWGKG